MAAERAAEGNAKYATITNSGDHGSVMIARGEITASNRETNDKRTGGVARQS